MELRPVHYRARAYLAASYGHLGRIDEARNQLSLFVDGRTDRLKKLGGQAPRPLSELVAEWTDRDREPSNRDHFLDGLRLAGWES